MEYTVGGAEIESAGPNSRRVPLDRAAGGASEGERLRGKRLGERMSRQRDYLRVRGDELRHWVTVHGSKES